MTAAPFVAVSLPEHPYPGLRPFDSDEWTIFFGRERMIDDVIGRLTDNRLVLIHGVSGSGKSSLVRAGVLPKLALQYRRHDKPWLFCAMRPLGGPLWNLAKEFAWLEGRGEDLERVSAIAGQFNARSATLASVTASLEGVCGKSVCILVDQFEELFRYERETSRDEAELFVDLIRRAASEEAEVGPGSVDLHVIVTMRSEFLGECARFEGFAETIYRTQYLVPRLDDDGLLRAMRRPAQMYGAEFDEGLAERLIASVRRREDELPMLQFGLMLMWEEAFSPAGLREHVRLDDTIVENAGGLPELLSNYADTVMVRVAPDQRRKGIVEALFRALTDVNSEGSAIRHPVAFHKLCAVTGGTPEELRPILDALRAPGVSFLTPYAPGPIDDKTVIDITHEALIRCWRRISDKEDGWLQREFRDGLWWRTLLFQADNFASDRMNILSAPATELGERRLEERNEAWADRYGGGWPKVVRLVEASREHWKREREATLEVQKRIAEAEEHRKAAVAQKRIADAERQARKAAEDAATEAKARAVAEGRAREAADEAARHAKARAEAEGQAREAADEAARHAKARAEAEGQAREAAERIAVEQMKATTAGRWTARVALVGLAVALLVAAAAVWQYLKATEAGAEAKANLRDAQITESRYLAVQAHLRRAADGDAGTAVLLSLEALPEAASAAARPFVPEAELQLNDAWRDLRERLVLGGDAGVNNSVFSPDGKRVLTASDDGAARMWDAATGQPIGEPLRGHDGAMLSASFSPDGRRIVAAFQDNIARIWDAATWRPTGEPLIGHDGPVSSASFSPDGQRIVTASWDKTARIWDAATGRPIGQPLRGDTGAVLGAAFSPDGQRIVTASWDNTARIWDAATGEPIGAPLRGHSGAVLSAAFSPDGWRVVTASWDKTARLWDAATGQPVGEPLIGHDGAVFRAVFSPDGKRIVTASEDRTSRIWDAVTGRPIGEPLGGHNSAVLSAAFSPDGRGIVTASDDKTARLWDVETGQLMRETLRGHDDAVTSVAFSSDGRQIVTASRDRTARIWDAATGRPIGEPLRGHDGPVTSAAFSPDGRHIVTASVDETARVWDAATGRPIGEPLKGHEDVVTSVAFSPDGTRVVTASRDKTVRIWDAASGKAIGEPLRGHEGAVWGAEFSPDGKRIVTASADKTARIWNAATGQPLGEPLRGHDGPVTSAAFSPDGRRIVTASVDETARIWDAATGQPLGEPLRGHDGPLTSAVFSPDGRHIVTASVDETARIWDAATGKAIDELTSREGALNSAAFSPDGTHIVTASEDSTARVWDILVDTQALVSHAKVVIPRCLTPAQRKAFHLPPEPPAWCIEMEKWPYDTPEWKQWLADKRAGKEQPLPVAP